jgi:hypothetical protein
MCSPVMLLLSRRPPSLPLNVDGKTKLQFEEQLREFWPRHTTFRSSNMIGPQPPYRALPAAKFLQWLDTALGSDSEQTTLFSDERRSFVSVNDITRVVCAAATTALQLAAPPAPPLIPGPPAPPTRVIVAVPSRHHDRCTACSTAASLIGCHAILLFLKASRQMFYLLCWCAYAPCLFPETGRLSLLPTCYRYGASSKPRIKEASRAVLNKAVLDGRQALVAATSSDSSSTPSCFEGVVTCLDVRWPWTRHLLSGAKAVETRG